MSGQSAEGQWWCATLAWRGDAYCGWQIQPNGPSIQDAVQTAVAKLCGLEQPVLVSSSGRTDAGVHAEMQVVGFCIPVERSPHQVISGINVHTPDDIVCLDAKAMPSDFSPRSWTKNKLYRYRILNRSVPCPFRNGVVWHIKHTLDTAAMSAALGALVGEHDFSSFRAARCAAQSPVRWIQAARLNVLDNDEVQIEFEGHGFLRHQVRIMVGTLVEVGSGRVKPEQMEAILLGRDRSLGGQTAPAQGLTLVSVELLAGPRI